MNNNMSNITSKGQLLEAYRNGARSFEDVELDTSVDLSDIVLIEVTFKHCWLNVNFIHTDLTGCRFIECSLKTADFRYANLTRAIIQGCTVESTRSSNAIVAGFVFSENSVYGQEVGQEDFDSFIHFT
jgi:uncharacterized protein YjbI with pentapeptide repeats